MNYAPLLVGLLAALVLVFAFAGGAFLGYLVSGRRRYDEGQRVGYDEGYAAMKAEHERYRRDNRAALAAIQNLTPDPNAATLGPSLEQPRTFDTSGAFDCHVETAHGAQAVGRGRTLEDARASARRVLARSSWRDVVITRPGEHGARVEVERVVRSDSGGLPFTTGARCLAELHAGTDTLTRQCTLPDGHAGAHDFVLPRSIDGREPVRA